ncbi:TIGR03621 family F420-dependent LLM class oxidoreductase [Streptomyces celluloflavus]
MVCRVAAGGPAADAATASAVRLPVTAFGNGALEPPAPRATAVAVAGGVLRAGTEEIADHRQHPATIRAFAEHHPRPPTVTEDARMRPFRFLATVNDNRRFDGLTSLARKAEAVGCAAFVLPDHLTAYAPIPPLAMVAAATERLRVGTFVLNIGLRHPAVLAQDLATLDALSGGRLEIGLGAGWNKPEHDAIGIPFEPVGVRIKRLTEGIAILKGCFAEGPFSFSGEHYTVTDHVGAPAPAQRPHPPFFLGGGGKRLLTLAAREAQIVGLAPRLVQGDRPGLEARSMTAAATEEKIGWIREAAGDRFDGLELNTYSSGGPTVVTGDPRAAARRRADHLREQTGVELTVEEILDSPHMFIGSVKDLTRKFVELRERFGISSFLIDDLDALAPVVEELAGR